MADSTCHNLGVIEEVFADLQTGSVPDSLVCHVYLTMVFQRKIKAVQQEIHDVFGANTIKECFLTSVDFCNESFIYKAITCLCSFINIDYSSIVSSILMFSLVWKRMNLYLLEITTLIGFLIVVLISYIILMTLNYT